MLYERTTCIAFPTFAMLDIFSHLQCMHLRPVCYRIDIALHSAWDCRLHLDFDAAFLASNLKIRNLAIEGVRNLVRDDY